MPCIVNAYEDMTCTYYFFTKHLQLHLQNNRDVNTHRATHRDLYTYDGKHTNLGPFTSIHAHCCFQSAQDPPLWMSLTACNSLNYHGWFPPHPTSFTPSLNPYPCVFLPLFFILDFSSSHISPGHRVVKIYERYSDSLWPHQYFLVK